LTRLLEDHAKELLERAGVSTPSREVARTRDEVFSAAARLGGSVVVKAHVSANRRAKAGGVRFADDPESAAQAADQIFGRLFDGRPAESMLVEDRVAFERELYLSLLVDKDRRRVVAIGSLDGGIDVEEAISTRGSLEVVELDVWGHESADRFRQLWSDLGLCGDALEAVVDTSVRAAEAFFATDATLLELNPIVLSAEQRSALALGAIIEIDDAALARQPDIAQVAEAASDRWRPPTELELEALDVASSEAHRGTARFIELKGDIGLLSGGGGGSQVLFESVLRAGGRPACFTEIGGNPSAEKVRRLTGIVLRCPGVRGLLVAHNLTSNTQVDLVATGVVAALAEGGFNPLEFPVVAREVGTHDEHGRAIFEEAGIEYLGENCTLESAARRIVQRVRERTAAVR
jgi:succinyl-CoA synthetase beta subunit/citryl-CoA synthetase large subunit